MATSQWNIWPWPSSEHGEWLLDIKNKFHVQEYHLGKQWTIREVHGSHIMVDIYQAELLQNQWHDLSMGLLSCLSWLWKMTLDILEARNP